MTGIDAMHARRGVKEHVAGGELDLRDSAALRFNGIVHAQNVAERDGAKQARAGLAPSLALGLGKPTRLTASYLAQTASDVPDYGLPWLGTRRL